MNNKLEDEADILSVQIESQNKKIKDEISYLGILKEKLIKIRDKLRS